uniref:t-SNARE coiled-coil homology domain-containing protein n=1 Tax=Toxocara canis TaxID=6265 RepID=A0A183VGT1_TOXCA
LNEIRMKIGRLKERLSSLDTSLGDDRGKPVNHLRGEVMELKEAIAKTTNEMIQTRNMVAGLDNKLVFIQERARVRKRGMFTFPPVFTMMRLSVAAAVAR